MILPANQPLVGYRTTALRVVLTVQLNGAPVDLTGWEIGDFSIRDRPGYAPRLVVTEEPTTGSSVLGVLDPIQAGQIEVLVTALDLFALPTSGQFADKRTFVHDLILTPPDGDASPYVLGPLVVWQPGSPNAPTSGEPDMVDSVTLDIGTGVSGRQAVQRATAPGDVQLARGGGLLIVAKAAPAPTVVTLPEHPLHGEAWTVKALGDAADNPVTVRAFDGGLIDGLAAYVINVPWMAVKFTFDAASGQWSPA